MNKYQNGLNRRDFLKTAGAAAAGGAILAGCGEKNDPYALSKPAVPGERNWYAGQEKWISSACGMCQAGCGIRVRVVQGRAVKIEGHPGCPVNRGGLGPKGQSGLQLLYHPDRLRGPLKRDGERGAGHWKPVSWKEAIDEIARRLRDLRTQGEARGLVVLDGEPRGMTRDLWERFLTAYGSPNHLDHHSTTDGGKILAMTYMHGVPELPAYDWESTRYVLGFGAGLFESWCQTIHLMQASSYLRRGTPGRRVKFVQISPRYSVTASQADEWIPIEPATYGALALGLAHVLVRDKLFDEAFVRDHTFGFEDWKDAEGHSHMGFHSLVTKEYPPELVSKITGVHVRTIERIAREMVEHHPAVVLADGGAAAATNGLGTAMSIHALNALLGSLERRGGMLVQHPLPLTPWPAVEPDETARRGRSSPRIDGVGESPCMLGRGFIQRLPEAILSGKPYEAKALILYRSNPFFSKPAGRRWIEAIRKIPLVISCSPLPDESTFWADFILPDHTYLERWEVVEPVPSVGYPILTLCQPAVEPLYNTMATGDVILQLARAIGPSLAEAFPWETFRKTMEERLNGLLEVKESSIEASDLTELRKGIEQNGAWWKTPYPYEQWNKAFDTPTGKFEFYSQEISRRLKKIPDPEKWLTTLGVVTRGDKLCLPHWEPPQFAGDPTSYPYILVVYRGIEYAEGGARHLPFLRELPTHRRRAWKERVEVNPTDAGRLGIREDDTVRVESPAGALRLIVHINSGIRPGTAAVPLGHGPWPPHPSPEEPPGGYGLLANLSDPLAGILALQGTRVRLVKEKRS